MNSNIYQFQVTNLFGQTVSLSDFKDEVLLIVNTASACRFTPQYQDLIELKEFFKDAPFEILAFPSNDFGQQEPMEAGQIAEFCSTQFKVNFRVFDKIIVKGKQAHPLYQFLSNKSQNGKVNIAPHWNFHKYLIDKNGFVVDYFWTFTKPNSTKIKKAIQKLL